jgi:hypothetical protein
MASMPKAPELPIIMRGECSVVDQPGKISRFFRIAAVLLLLNQEPSIVAQPPNDAFLHRTPLHGEHAVAHASMAGTTIEDASIEVSLPDEMGDRISVSSLWWTWIAPADGGVQISARGSEFLRKSVLVFSGDELSSLRLLGGQRDDGTIEVPVTAGHTYQIAILTEEIQNAEAILSLDYIPPPTNDAFSARHTITEASNPVIGSLLGATVEADEPFPSGSAFRIRHDIP